MDGIIEVTRSDYKELMKVYLDAIENKIHGFSFKYENAPKSKRMSIKQAKSALDLYEMVYDMEKPERKVRISVKY